MAPRSFCFDLLCLALAAIFLSVAGCFGGQTLHPETEFAVGETHEVNFPADQTLTLTQDVLRGQGVQFDTKPGSKIVTFWKPADIPVGTFSSLIGNNPRYRYELEIVPDGSHRSKIVANVRTEYIPEDQIDDYRATRKLNLFADFDQLVTKLPPPPTTPGSGGVNFALLPGEDLAALSRRVTGTPDNWPQIAKDNGLKSVNDVAGVSSVWVDNHLLPKAKSPTSPVPEGN